MSDHDQLIASAIDALETKMARDGLPHFHDARMAVAHAALRLHDHDVENLVAYWMDRQQRLIGVEVLATGGVSEVSFSRKEIVRRALQVNAAEVILAHNHPSGDQRPSDADVKMATMLDGAFAAIGILVNGHFIVSSDGYTDVRAGSTFTWAEIKGDRKPVELPRCKFCHGVIA